MDKTGIEKYRIETYPSFENYYDLFLKNTSEGRFFKITSIEGDSLIGIPTAHLMVDISDPDVSFTLRTYFGDIYRIPYKVLEKVEEIDE